VGSFCAGGLVQLAVLVLRAPPIRVLMPRSNRPKASNYGTELRAERGLIFRKGHRGAKWAQSTATGARVAAATTAMHLQTGGVVDALGTACQHVLQGQALGRWDWQQARGGGAQDEEGHMRHYISRERLTAHSPTHRSPVPVPVPVPVAPTAAQRHGSSGSSDERSAGARRARRLLRTQHE